MAACQSALPCLEGGRLAGNRPAAFQCSSPTVRLRPRSGGSPAATTS